MKTHLFRSSAGINHSMVTEGQDTRFVAEADVGSMLEYNKAQALHNDGYTADRTVRRAASIPHIVGLKWYNEEGWWWMDYTHDPDVARKLVQKLNSSEWSHLRIAPGRLAVNNGELH